MFGLGADWCNAARAFMFALGCVQSMNCHTGKCPTGIATQVKWRQRGLNIEYKGDRVARFHRQTLHGFREIVVAMGLDNPWQIMPSDLHERINGAKSCEIDRIHSFLEPGILLTDPAETALARHWAMARADSFRRIV
jgi:hypothetical protein